MTDTSSPPPRDDPRTDKILAASKAMFLEQGYDATSMDQVAQAARVSKTTLYTRFPSKEALFSATIGAECERRGMRFGPGELDHLPIEEGLVRIGLRFVDLIWSDEALRIFRLAAGDAGRFPEVARLYFAAGPTHAVRSVATFLERAQERGVLPRLDDSLFAARMLLSMLQAGPWFELVLGIGTVPTPEQRDAFVHRVVRVYLAGITAEAAQG
ncbi:TetR/AcrR family transcriptional regulator [Azospirillum halopraeferens]|uniref:TetR/AcrR family transcriptional regulator n=1 Tax=Azospirillum halopraeferens TaxID=34010 RepID=UPI0003F8FD9B|nr:TetR/AcrR family transcriptional regulator [Azospirillum halopraeferens]